MTNEEATAFAAGLFEGEGCWYIKPDGLSLAAALTTTDLDVLEKFKNIVGAGSITTRTRHEGRKQEYEWRTSGTLIVQNMAERFRPYLGKRRLARFAEICALRDIKIDELTAARLCQACGCEFRPVWSKAAARTIYCSADCRQRYGAHRQWLREKAAGGRNRYRAAGGIESLKKVA